MFRLAALDEGVWTVRVEMIGFAPASRRSRSPSDAPSSTWELKLLPLAGDDPRSAAMTAAPERASSASAARATPGGTPPATAEPARVKRAAGRRTCRGSAAAAGFQRAQVNASAAGAAIVNDPSASGDADRGGADGFLINGSVNNGAASPFAQLAAFGNNRRNARSLYNGGIGLLRGNSALDSRPFSFTGQPTPKPSYNDVQIIASFAGPLRIPHLLTQRPEPVPRLPAHGRSQHQHASPR